MTSKEIQQAKDAAIACREQGGSFYDCSLAASVDRSTLHRWRKNDATFATALRLAKSNFKLSLVRQVRRKQPEFLLERMFVKEFGRHKLKEVPKKKSPKGSLSWELERMWDSA